MKGLLAVVLSTGLLVTAAHGVVDRDSVEALRRSGKAFASVAKEAMPAVVFIKVEKTVGVYMGPRRQYNDPHQFFRDDFLERFFGQQTRPRQFPQMGQGTGFLISKDGYILTNNHVVGDADKITVRLHGGEELQARRVGADPRSEVAVIKIEGKDFPHIELGDSAALEVGEWVIAIGNPFGLAETLTVGVVSAKGRSGIGIADYEDFIQTDAAINPGNSGGPLLNVEGKAVGINTAIYSQSGGYMGIGFAIPVNMAKLIKDQLEKTGKVMRGYIGIHLQELTGELAESLGVKADRGIVVTDVVDGSPGEKAGLKRDDIIVKLNGSAVESVSSFRNAIASAPPGTKVRLNVLRGSKDVEVSVSTGALPDEEGGGTSEAVQDIGLKVDDLTRETAQQFGYAIGDGAIVTEVDEDSPAWRAGVRAGHLITAVNRMPVKSAREFQEAMGKAGRRDRILLLVKAGRLSRYVVIPLK
jgi:serine protease Do